MKSYFLDPGCALEATELIQLMDEEMEAQRKDASLIKRRL